MMIADAMTALAADNGLDSIEQSGFVDFPEAGELLRLLLGAMEAPEAIVSLHADGGERATLHRAGSGAGREALAASAARLVAGRRFDGGAGDGVLTCDTLDDGAIGQEAWSIGFPCRESGTCVTVSGLFPREPAERRPMRVALLRRMAPVLDAAFKLWQRHRRLVQDRRGLAGALDSVDFGIILIDRDGDMGFANAAARALLAEGRFLRQRGGALSANHLRDTMKVQAALAAAIASNLSGADGGDEPPEAGLLQLNADGRRIVVAAIPAERPATEPGSIAAMLVAHDPDRRSDRLVAPVCRLFGLSTVETRLASHLVAGFSLAEASKMMRIKEQTARGYLKQVFLKANVKRQSDLVRLLLSSLLNTRVRAALRAI